MIRNTHKNFWYGSVPCYNVVVNIISSQVEASVWVFTVNETIECVLCFQCQIKHATNNVLTVERI